jgi:hypothetical protein
MRVVPLARLHRSAGKAAAMALVESACNAREGCNSPSACIAHLLRPILAICTVASSAVRLQTMFVPTARRARCMALGMEVNERIEPAQRCIAMQMRALVLPAHSLRMFPRACFNS